MSTVYNIYCVRTISKSEVIILCPNKKGRPPKNDDEKKSVRLELRLTIAESDLITALAKKHNVTKTDIVLKAINHLAGEK